MALNNNAININAGFEVGSQQPLDSRQWLSTSEMKNVDVNIMPDPYYAINKEDHFLYIFSKTNPISESTGYFTKYTNDGGMTVWKGSEAERDALPEETKADESIIFYTWDVSDVEYKNVVSKTIGIVENMSEADYQALETKDAGTIYATPGHIRVGEEDIVSDESIQYVVISDSYGGRNNDGETMTVWEELLRRNLHKTEGVNYFYGWYGGSGFANGKFIEILKAICGDTATLVPEYKTTETPNFSQKTIILVAGGWNDVGQGVVEIRTAIKAFSQYAVSKFSNVEIKLACVASGNPAVDVQHTTAQYDAIKDVVRSYAYPQLDNACVVSYIHNSEYILHVRTLWQSDGYHPNASGHNFIAITLSNGIINGACDIHEISDDSSPLAVASGGIMTQNNNGGNGTVAMQSQLSNGLLTLKCSAGQIACDGTTIVSGFTKIAKVTLQRAIGTDSTELTQWIPQTIYCQFTSTQQTTVTWGLITVLFRLNRDWLEGMFTAIGNGFFHTNIRITCMQFPGFIVSTDPMIVR
jgi:lysophospholipase L1-like esterase